MVALKERNRQSLLPRMNVPRELTSRPYECVGNKPQRNVSVAMQYPMDWQGVKFRGKRPTIENTFRAIAHNFPNTYSTQKLLVSKLFLISTSKRLRYKNFSRMIKYPSCRVLKASKVLMFCQDFYAQVASPWDSTHIATTA